ncbi:GTP-binding protein [Algoriphagus aquimarinus]|uniref:CobW family GTP-binding protein n=1 Tax=Algoriphagus aquimarinus TaxID=237018 RepID=UPI0030DA422C
MKAMNSKKINVFLLTGFLGAGKTTLLNHILEAKKAENNIVIENEFGKVSIDSRLVTCNYDSIFEMNNGCICCSLDNDLVDVLARILSSEIRPDNLFIEASGVADPGGIAALFSQEEVSQFFDLKQITCIVDASCVEDWLEEIPEISRQLAAADVIVLNKKSMVTQTYLLSLEKLLQSLNSMAEIISVDHANTPLEIFSGRQSLWTPQKAVLSNEKKAAHPLKSLLVETSVPFDKKMLLNQLTMVLLISYHQVFRIKGVIWCYGEKLPFIIQTHGKQVNISTYTGENWPEYPLSQVIVIGKELQQKPLGKLFKRAYWRETSITEAE